MKTYKSKHTFIIFFLLTLSLNIFAQQKAERLPVYETTLNLSKIYKQGEIILLGENDDIRIYSSSNHQTENSVAINPVNPNNIIVQTNGRNIYDGNGNYITTHQTYFYTTDGGINWSGSEDNPNGIYTRGDPVALFDYYGNAFYITLGNPGGIYVLKSTDGGASWGSTVNADPLNSSGDDKEHAAADISGTYPNNIYIAWTDFSTTNKDVVLTRSTNGGSSFEGTRKILYSGADRGQGTNIAIGPNGEVYIAFANYTNGYLPESGIRFIKSTNGGSTFLTANIAFTISGIRTSNIGLTEFNNTRVNSYPSMGVDRSNGSRRGWIYIVYADKNTGDADIYLRRSTNGGLTWSSAIRVNSDPVSNGKQQWFPSIDVDQVTGKIYVSYYNMDSTGYLTSRYVAVSENGGDSFVCKRISDVRFTPSALGAGYADGYMGDYYETAVYNSRLYPTWSDNRAGNFQAFISPYGGIKVDQLLSDNTTHIGNVGNWNGSQFVDYQIPVSFDFSVGSNPVLRGSQAIMSNQKYNNWNYDNDVTNHRSFLITPGTVELISKFQSTNSGITIKNSLEGTSVSGGNIDFKDPWLIDYTDPLYGNNIRSQGMNAPFKTRTSPFYPDTSTSYNGDVYKGVFLNQGLPNWAPPYYSVEAQSPQNINLGGALGTHKFYFQNWSGTGVSYQYPNSLQTPVVFTSSNAKAQAVMKGTQLSNNINAFSNSSQRKFVRTTDGNLWMVYESMKKVWLEKSTDNGATWDIMNNGKALSDKESKSPSIDYEFGTIGVVFQEKYGNSYKIIFQYFYTNGTIFNSYTVEDSSGFIYPDPYGFDSQPVIAWSTNGKFLVVWREKNNPGLHYRLGAVNQFIWGVEWYTASGLIDNTDGKSKNASVAVLKSGTSSNFHLAWEQGPSYEKIKYYKINVNSDNTISFSDYYEVSSPTGYGIGIQPVIVVKNDNNPMIIYKLGGGNGGYSNDIVRREKYSYGWSSVEMIYLPNRLISSASLGYADDGTYVTFFTDNWNKVWYKRSYWSTGPYQISGLTA